MHVCVRTRARLCTCGVCACVCACVCVCVHYWWLSGLHSGLLVERLGVQAPVWHDVQLLFSIQQCGGYPPNIIPTPVHPTVMGWGGGGTPLVVVVQQLYPLSYLLS